jgi:hypothetical protein
MKIADLKRTLLFCIVISFISAIFFAKDFSLANNFYFESAQNETEYLATKSGYKSLVTTTVSASSDTTILSTSTLTTSLLLNRTVLTEELKLNSQYNDEKVRAEEKEACDRQTECIYYSKKNTWHPTKFAIISNNTWNLCTNDSGSDLDLFIHLWTRITDLKLRQAIRSTYANRSLFPTLNVGFIVGASLNESLNSIIYLENEKYGDIIQGDFIDTYRNLSFKSLTAWRWIIYNCQKAKYFLKIDGE